MAQRLDNEKKKKNKIAFFTCTIERNYKLHNTKSKKLLFIRNF